MNEKRTGTSLCGWCLGPPGAKRPHRFGVQVSNCPCGCHCKPKTIITNADIATWKEHGYAPAKAA